MNCKRHPGNEAVAQCTSCGGFVCKECTDLTENGFEAFGTLCTDCYERELHEAVAYHEEKKNNSKRFMIISMVLFGVGLIAFIVGYLMTNVFEVSYEYSFYAILAMLGGYLMMGVFPGIKAWKDAFADQEKREEIFGETYQVSEDGSVHKTVDWAIILPQVAVKLLFGPVTSIMMWLGFKDIMKESDDYLNLCYEELAKLR